MNRNDWSEWFNISQVKVNWSAVQPSPVLIYAFFCFNDFLAVIFSIFPPFSSQYLRKIAHSVDLFSSVPFLFFGFSVAGIFCFIRSFTSHNFKWHDDDAALMSLSFKPIALQQNRNITQIKLILPQSKYYNNINVILNRLGFSIHSFSLFLSHILHWIGFIYPRAHKWKTGTDYTVCLLCNSGTVFSCIPSSTLSFRWAVHELSIQRCEWCRQL